MHLILQSTANIDNWVRIQMSSLVNSREKQLCEYHKNLLVTEQINEILGRLAKLPLVTPKLWVHAKKSSTFFYMSTQVGGIPRELHSKERFVFLWHLLRAPLLLKTILQGWRGFTGLGGN